MIQRYVIRFGVLIMLFILVWTTGCQSGDPVTSDTSVDEPESRPSSSASLLAALTVSDENMEHDEIADELFRRYLAGFMDPALPADRRIRDFIIESIEVREQNENGFQFLVTYSVLPDQEEDYVLAGNGRVRDDGWITNRTYFADVRQDGERYYLTNVGTGP
ncbi:MAG: hypothetical protein H0Z33_15545 [Bacillaceae bacterium]|nr:hypothetical protein [Bacillaceae bacterium]